MSINEQLLKAIRERQSKQTAFNYGILTADRYVQTLLDAAGSDICYAAAAKGLTSFADVLEKATQTLVYSNENMCVQEKAIDRYSEKLPDGVVLPKNTLMVFRHTLTTPRKDRDGDILHPEGMEVDPKMLLLWQHVHTMPIGKMLCVALQNSKTLDLWSCIIDLNETSHDAAVMVDNDMGRFSHGFKALEFDKVKTPNGTTGFDIKRAEIMEESLVSVPANVDSETQDVILSLVEGGKLTSPMMKEIGKSLRANRNVSVVVKLGLEDNDERETDGETGASEKASTGIGDKTETGDEKAGANEEVKSHVYAGQISDSWEYISDYLRSDLRSFFSKNVDSFDDDRDFVYLVATFSDSVIACLENPKEGIDVCYQINWKMIDGKPKLQGKPIEVDVETKTEIIKKGLIEKAKLILKDKGAEDNQAIEEESQEQTEEEAEKEAVTCPKCGSKNIKDGVCEDCGYKLRDKEKENESQEQEAEPDEDDIKKNYPLIGEKKGRVLSITNERILREAKAYIDKAYELGPPLECKACINHASNGIDKILKSVGDGNDIDEIVFTDQIIQMAVAEWIAGSTMEGRKRMISTLQHLNECEMKKKRIDQYRSLLLGN